MKKFLYILPLALLSVLSCEKELDYEIPDPGPRAVIDARIHAGSGVEAFISRSVFSLSSEDPSTSDDFTVRLYTDDPNSPFDLVPETYNVGYEPYFVYRSAQSIEQNKDYRLVVTGPGIPQAEVSERVLNALPFQKISYNQDSKEFTFSVLDDDAHEDYYMITINGYGADDLYFSSIDLDLEFFEFDSFFGDGDTEGRRYGNKAFVSDANFNGKQREFKVRIEGGDSQAVFVELRFHHISKSYFRYELTKSAYNYSDGLFSEPTQIYSNVNNGYGIFATAAATVYKVQY